MTSAPRRSTERRGGYWWRQVLVVAAACSLVAACGSSSSTTAGKSTSTTAASATGGSTGSTTATPTGTPLNVLTLASVDYNGPTYANILTTAKLYGDWINAHGGIKGHPLHVTTCDEHGDPNKTAACGRQAISDHDVAVIGSYTLNGSSIIPELQAANISWFGICCAASIDELTSPDVQQLGSGGGEAGAVVKVVEDGCKHTAFVILNTGASLSLYYLELANALKSVNAPASLFKTVLVPLTATDYSPEVAQATTGTDCILTALGESEFPSFMPAYVQDGAHQRLYGYQGNLDITVTKPYPQQTEGAIIVGYYSDLSLPQWADYRQAIADYHAPSNENYNSLGGLGTWAGYQAFTQIADSLTGPINNVTFLAAAQKATINLPGEVATTNFSLPFTALGPDFRNDVNRSITFDIAHNGVLVPWDGGKFFDMTNAMEGKPLAAGDTPPPGGLNVKS